MACQGVALSTIRGTALIDAGLCQGIAAWVASLAGCSGASIGVRGICARARRNRLDSKKTRREGRTDGFSRRPIEEE